MVPRVHRTTAAKTDHLRLQRIYTATQTVSSNGHRAICLAEVYRANNRTNGHSAVISGTGNASEFHRVSDEGKGTTNARSEVGAKEINRARLPREPRNRTPPEDQETKRTRGDNDIGALGL